MNGNVEISFHKCIFVLLRPGESLLSCVVRGPHEVLGAQRPQKRFGQTLGVAGPCLALGGSRARNSCLRSSRDREDGAGGGCLGPSPKCIRGKGITTAEAGGEPKADRAEF